MRILVVEDDNERINWFKRQALGMPIDIVTTAAEGLALLEQYDYTQIFLDHDLADHHYRAYDGHTCTGEFDEETGFSVARFLGANPQKSEGAEIFVHSLNEPAARRMVRELHQGRRNYHRIPFNRLRVERGDLGRKERSIWDY